MKKLVLIALALVLVAVSSFAMADTLKIGFAQVGHESDWRAANTLDYQTTFTEENGYELLFVDADNDHTKQMEAVRNFINQEVDYIVICPVQEAGWEVVLQEAKDAGIPVIIADRTNGFNKIAEEHAEWKIIDSQSGDFTQAGGQQVMESYLKSYPGQFNVVVCQNDNEAYGAMDAMKAAGVTYGEKGDVILISFDATKEGLTRTLAGEINCDVECNPLQAKGVAEIIQKLEAGEEVPSVTIVPDEAFVAPSITSEFANTMTQEILDGRAY